eukprot:4237370-Amphidinium_carterae.1
MQMFSETEPQELASCEKQEYVVGFSTVGQDEMNANQQVDYLTHEVPEESLENPEVLCDLVTCAKTQPYILDIDLDFFVLQARNQPSKPEWIRAAYDACTRWLDPTCEFWRGMDVRLTKEIAKKSPSSKLFVPEALL